MAHHSIMTSSLLIKNLKTEKFGDFSCNLDYNSRTQVFSDAIHLIIDQCDHRRPKVSASRAAHASEARLYHIISVSTYHGNIISMVYILTIKTRLMCIYIHIQ